MVGDWEWLAGGDVRDQLPMWERDINITQSDSFTCLLVRTVVQRDNLTNDTSWDLI